MFGALTANALARVQVVRDFIRHHDALLAGKDASTRQEMKVYSVSSSVTRLYAIYENFVESLLTDYLDFIPEVCVFTSLAQEIQKEYRAGISYLLSRIEQPRYSHLNHAHVIQWYHEALSSKPDYRFVPEALTRHDENLRLSALGSMLARVQLTDLHGWLSNHEAIASQFTERIAVWAQLEAELKNFVELRNDAAHGSMETLPGDDTLIRYCDLVAALMTALSSYLYREATLWRARVGKGKLLGRVSEVFRRNRAFILPLTAGAWLEVQQTVQLVGRWSCIDAVVESLRYNDRALRAISVPTAAAGLELGVVTTSVPTLNTEVYVDI